MPGPRACQPDRVKRTRRLEWTSDERRELGGAIVIAAIMVAILVAVVGLVVLFVTLPGVMNDPAPMGIRR